MIAFFILLFSYCFFHILDTHIYAITFPAIFAVEPIPKMTVVELEVTFDGTASSLIAKQVGARDQVAAKLIWQYVTVPVPMVTFPMTSFDPV
jgi:hypothetical protein